MKYLITFALSLGLLGAGCVPNQLATNTAPKPTDSPKDTILNLSGEGLTSIPSSVFSRTELTTLDLSFNRLTGAPQAEIRQLQALKALDLSDNQLTGLPAELGQLKNLETLDVSNNKLTGLPLELGNLTQLRVLDVSGNDYSKQDLDQIAAKLTKTEIRR